MVGQGEVGGGLARFETGHEVLHGGGRATGRVSGPSLRYGRCSISEGPKGPHDERADQQSVGEIEADIAATRARLASTIDELAVRAQPKEIARRQADSAKVKLNEATHTPTGELRIERIAAVVAAVVALVGLVVWRRTRG